jgi:hypothetical protein
VKSFYNGIARERIIFSVAGRLLFVQALKIWILETVNFPLNKCLLYDQVPFEKGFALLGFRCVIVTHISGFDVINAEKEKKKERKVCRHGPLKRS